MKKFLLLISLLILSSCNHNPNKLNIKLNSDPRIENVTFYSNSIRLNLGIDINSSRKLKLSDINLKIADEKNSQIGIIKVSEEIKILRGQNEITVPLRIYLSGNIFNIQNYLKNNLQINGSLRVKSGLFRKRISIENIPITNFIKDYLQ